MSKAIVTDIEWDTSDNDCEGEVDLSTSMEIEIPSDIIAEGVDAVDSYVSDEISNESGFCHKGFNFTVD